MIAVNFPTGGRGTAELPPKIKTIMNEIKSRLSSLSSNPFNRKKTRSENVKKAKEIVLSLYEFCLSNEYLDEEGFFDIMESLLIDYLTEYEPQLEKRPLFKVMPSFIKDFLLEYSITYLVELITPDNLAKEVKEELKIVAKEAFATYKVRKELGENLQLRKELIKALQEKSYAGKH